MRRGHISKKEVLEQLGVGRRGALQVCREAKVNSVEYRAAEDVSAAIDDLAEILTGDAKYFHIKMAPTSQLPKGPRFVS
jgi:hypothetical protein